MRGKLDKNNWGKWFVKETKTLKNCFGCKPYDVISVYELHPDDVKQIEQDAKIFDNIEARIAAYPDVDFEIVIDELENTKYAKLIPDTNDEEYPELEGTLALCNDIIDKRYQQIEQAIIRWSNDGTKTAGELTREIMNII